MPYSQDIYLQLSQSEDSCVEERRRRKDTELENRGRRRESPWSCLIEIHTVLVTQEAGQIQYLGAFLLVYEFSKLH